MDIGGRVASGTAAEKMSGSAKPTRRGTYFRNTDDKGNFISSAPSPIILMCLLDSYRFLLNYKLRNINWSSVASVETNCRSAAFYSPLNYQWRTLNVLFVTVIYMPGGRVNALSGQVLSLVD